MKVSPEKVSFFFTMFRFLKVILYIVCPKMCHFLDVSHLDTLHFLGSQNGKIDQKSVTKTNNGRQTHIGFLRLSCTKAPSGQLYGFLQK